MLVVQGVDAVKYVNAKAVDPEQWPPKYWKILLELEGEYVRQILVAWAQRMLDAYRVDHGLYSLQVAANWPSATAAALREPSCRGTHSIMRCFSNHAADMRCFKLFSAPCK